MSFIGIVTNTKNEMYLSKVLLQNFKAEQIIFITDKNIENMRNVRFETIILDAKLNHIEELKGVLSNAKYLILNSDIIADFDMFENLNLVVISYGFQSKATFTVSSVSDDNIIICLQRIMKSANGNRYEPQEIEIEKEQDVDVYAVICLKILLLFYEKIQILVN